MTWAEVLQEIPKAHAFAFDGCHKIYLLMDAAQVAQSRDWGYGDGLGSSQLVMADELDGLSAAREILCKWWGESCDLKFISAVKTVKGDPNKGYTSLIGQFDEEG